LTEQLEARQLMAADPFANEPDVVGLPFALEFTGADTLGLHDKDGEHLGFTRVQVNKNGRDASYVAGNLDVTGGLLNITTTGTSTSGSNFNADNTLTNAVETTFDAASSGFQITARLIGPMGYINQPSEQAGISFGPGQDEYVKFVAVSTPQGQRLQFVDERVSNGTYFHDLDVLRDVGAFSTINTLDLRLTGDAATGKVSASYSINGNAFQSFTQQLTLTGTRKAAFFSPTAKAGLVAAHKNNNGAITASFDRFEITPGTPVSGRPTVAAVSPGHNVSNVARDVFIRTQLNLTGGGIASGTLDSTTVRLYRTSDHHVVQANVGTSGAGDVIILTPSVLLDKNTSYTFEVTDGLQDVAGNAFVPFSSTFTTGTTGGEIDPSFSFEKVGLSTATGEKFTALKVGPDRKLYAGTDDGRIFRFPLRADGTLGAPQVLNAIQTANGGNKRLLTGFAFDPASTASNPILWVTHGQYRFGLDPNGTADENKYADDWTGKISRITNLGGNNTGTVADVVKSLPRSVRDHLTNQPSFGPDGALYIPQGSNSAMGAPDKAWGNRPERLLSGAILRLDPSKVPAGTTLDVKTEDGGTYNPNATGAALTIYAKGVRNAYDLVWTGDGNLYAPTNGSAKGGNTPAGPSGSGIPGLTAVAEQRDFLFKIEPGGYYGHPNPLRGDYVLNGGYTPADGVGPDEVPQYADTTQPDSEYKGFAYDFDFNVSPNGVIEYTNETHFGGRLANKLLVVRYSGPDDVMVLTRDASGAIVQAQKGIVGLGGFVDPLDIIEDPTTGFLYVSEYSERDAGKRKITLLRPIAPGAQATADKPRLVFTDIQTASTGGAAATASQAVTIKNTGTSTLTIPAGGVSIVDDPSLTGNHAAEFEADGWPALPASVPVGESITFGVRFRAASVGLKGAFLRVQSNDVSSATLDVALRGIGTTSDSAGDVSGSHEASLQRILDAFQIPVNVGDANGADTYDLPTPRPAGTVHDEVDAQRLRKAGAGPVRIEGLAGYGFNPKTGPVGHFGTYVPGNRDSRTELFTVALNERTSTNPTWGATFDPGGAEFGLWGTFNGSLFELNGQPYGVYSEDTFNTWEPIADNRRKVRFFPLKNADGGVEPNAYVFAFEEFKAGYDSNDIVGIIRNVQPAPADTGGEIGVENRDGVPFANRLVFNRIQDPINTDDATPKPNNKVHDTSVLRIHNSGSQPLTISSLALSNNAFQLVSPPAANAQVAPGGSLDVTVKFVATSGDLRTGTLTINSSDADEPATVVQLAGFWQSISEGNQEPTLQEMIRVFGYGTTITHPGEALSAPGSEGKLQRVGDEVLSAYWKRADAARGVTVRQLAAYHTQGNVAKVWWYPKGGTTATSTLLFTHDGEYGQSLLPTKDGSDTDPAFGVFKPLTGSPATEKTFGFKIDTEWSDPVKNTTRPKPADEGHHVRFWVAKDRDGKVIPDTYLMAMDYSGINYDYQDNVYLVTNIKPESGPSTPANLTATGSGSGIALNWDDNTVANLAGYNVYRGTTSTFTPGSANRLNTTGLLTHSDFNDIFAPTETTQYYKVSAVDTSGNESGFASADAIRSNDTTPPAAPANLVVTGSASGVTLDWDNNAEADLAGYDVLRSTASDGTFTTLNTGGLLTTSSYVDTTAAEGVTYFYQVVAKDQSGNTSAAATGSGTRGQQGPTVPAAPSGLLASGTSSTSASLTWGAADGATGYRVERRVDGTVDFTEIATGVTDTSYVDDTLAPSTKYNYRVRAENAAGLSPYSNVDSATTSAGTVTAPEAPTGLSATAASHAQVNLAWAAPAGASSYRIERRVAGASTFDEIATGVAGTTYQDAGRAPGTAYEYRVRAENTAGLSGYSNVAAATTPAAPTAPAYTAQDVGAASPAGSFTPLPGGADFDMTAGGPNIYDAADGFHFAHRQITGDFDVKVRIASLTKVGDSTKAGLMARSTLNGNSANVYSHISTNSGFRISRRATTGGSTGMISPGTKPVYPNAWVRLQRVGNTFTAYRSTDGVAWVSVGSYTQSMPATLFVGMAATSNSTTATTTAQFRGMGDTNATEPEPAPAPGVPANVAAQGVSPGQVDVSWDAASNAAGYRVERKGPGDADFVEIASPTGTSYSDTGRAANTTYEYRVRAVNASGVFSAYSAVATGTTTQVPAPAAPAGLSATATSHTQVDLSWTAPAGATSYRIERRVAGGSAFEEIATGVTATTYQDAGRVPETTYEYQVRAENAGGLSPYSAIASATTPAEPMQSPYTAADVGAASPAGSTTALPGGRDYDMTAGGPNIFGNADGFHFAHRQITGDFDLKVRIASMATVGESTKAGLMARSTLNGNSANVYAHVSSNNGFRLSRRSGTGGGTSILSANTKANFPNAWVRLRRAGDTFTAFRSTDGVTWTTIGAYTQAMPATLHVGMAATSNSTTATTTAQFRDLGDA
jgi:fibronectin type 3 domain-containing protein/regulation of enolase protein 1 (concanavalin A-like superfamily)